MDTVPFPADVELIGKLIDRDIPNNAAANIGQELSCPVLEELYPILDFIAVKSSEHIDPIHKHVQKGRKIVLTEDPNLHLVWNYGLVYIKPLPHCLLSYSFWNTNLAPGSEHRSKALGFMRSYDRLIRYPSDFELAKEARLIPFSSPPPLLQPGQQFQEELTYTAFVAFIRHFSSIKDASVSPRWHFGQIRLSRLNWAVRILQPKAAREKGFMHSIFYEPQFWQIGQFLNDFAAPLLFLFAALSLILSGMQVVLAAKSGDEGSWRVFVEVSAWFAVLIIILLVMVFVCLGGVLLGIWAWQFQFGYRSWKQSRALIGASNLEIGAGGGGDSHSSLQVAK